MQTPSADRNTAAQEIRAAESELQRERDRVAARGQAAADAIARLARADAQVAVLQQQLAGSEDVRARLSLTRQSHSEHQTARSTLHAENQLLRAKMDEIKASLQLLEAGEAACPTCRRPITPDDRDRFSELWHAEGTALGDMFRSNRERLKELDRELSQLDEDIQRLAADDLELAGLRGQLAQLTAGLAERERHELAAAECTAEIQRLDGLLSSGDFAHDARGRLAEAEHAIAQLNYDPAAHEHAEEQERVWQPFVARRQELELARSQHASVKATLVTLREQHAELSLSIASTSALVTELAVKLADVGDLRERRATAHETCDTLDTERGRLRGELGKLEGIIATLAEVEQQRDELSQRAAAQALDIGALTELVRAFGKDGIQAMIVENILPELQDEANAILRRMSTSQLQVTFRSQREALSSDKSIETLDIIIRDEYGERPYALYSGGEAFRVNFAVRVALSKLLARRAGARIDILVVDEGFGTQDSRGRDGLIEALRSIEDDFATILVITHIGEIRDLFPTRIDIVKSDRGSLISVN
jgi:DNA repair protein SbcC/Rad50